MRSKKKTDRFRGQMRQLTLPLVAAVFVFLGCSKPAPETMVIFATTGEYLIAGDGWWPIEGDSRVAVISPSEYYKYDAVDLASLVMPAVPGKPVEVALQTVGGEERQTLMFGAGVDVATSRLFGPKQPGRFLFQVFKNDEVAFETTITAHRDMGFEDLIWKRPTGGGLPCNPGDRFRLRTEMLGPEVPVGALVGVKLGFSGLSLRREYEVPRQAASEDSPNIILIVEDTMRADRSKRAGYSRDVVPNLDALAARGVEYRNAYATASWTWPSTASILTGLLPDAHGVVSNESCNLATGVETLPEVLQRRGYTTGAFTRNPLISADKGFGQGFEDFDSSHDHLKTVDAMPAIESWLDQQADRRFFLYLHLVDPHGPTVALKSQLDRLGIEGTTALDDAVVDKKVGGVIMKQFNDPDLDGQALVLDAFPGIGIEGLIEQYDACVASGDEYLGQIMRKVEALGLTGKTVIAFTSDHGEEWLDHGLLRHTKSLHKETVQVPLVIAGPGVAEGEVRELPVSNRHIASTLAYFGGTELEDVVDPINLVESTKALTQAPLFFSTHHGFWGGQRNKKIYGVRDGDWALHLGQGREGEELGAKLFNLFEDPGELTDVSGRFPEQVDRLRQLLLESISREVKLSNRLTGGLQVGAAGATLEFLARIGYLDAMESGEE